MKSQKSLVLWFAAIYIITIVAFVGVPRLRTEEMGSRKTTWMPTWKNQYQEPTNGNHHDEVCIGDQRPCLTPPAGTPDYIVHAVSHWIRFPQDVWEDATTKPWQVLPFIGAKPGDRVVDIISVPGDRINSMYWSRIFYHLVGDEGRVFPFYMSVGCRAAHQIACQMDRDFGSSSKGYGIRPFYTLLGDPRWSGLDEALAMENTFAFRNFYSELDVAGQFAVPEEADVVWSSGVWHQLHGESYVIDMDDFMPRVFEEIQNGGSLVIADYAGNTGTGFTQVDSLHRIDKEAVKKEVTKYGFIFDSESNIWARKDDDHTRRVPEASMPGVADMFILKFKKPVNAPAPRRETREQMGGWLDANYSESGDMQHGKIHGGGTWFNYDYTVTELQSASSGSTQGMIDSWFNNASGAICQRQEYSPITRGIIGCHYDYETLTKFHHIGDVWEERTDFCSEQFSFSGCYPRVLTPWHTWAERPQGCTLPTLADPSNDCRFYYENSVISYGHLLN